MMIASFCMMLFGAWCLVSGRWRWENRDKPVGLIILTLGIYAAGSSAISWAHGDPLSNFVQYLPFLGAGFLAIGLRVAAPSPVLIGGAFAAAAVLAGGASIVQVLAAGETHRANFLAFSTWFGTRGALYAIICASLLGWAAAADSAARRGMYATGFYGGVATALLSGSKGALLPLLAVAPFAFLRVFRRSRGIHTVVWVALVVLSVSVVTLLPHSPVIPRIKEALREGDRLRWAYWNESWSLAYQKPWLGAGRTALKEQLNTASLKVREGTPLEEAPQNAHNEYIDILGARGTVGLALTIGCYIVPLLVFWRLRNCTAQSEGPAAAGLLFLCAFAVRGLTDVQFAVYADRMTFLFVVLYFASAASANTARR